MSTLPKPKLDGTEMAWMFKPKFSADGESYTLEKWKLVPAKSIKRGGPMSFEQLKKVYWRPENA